MDDVKFLCLHRFLMSFLVSEGILQYVFKITLFRVLWAEGKFT
jgi:hypothetical protein